MTSWSDWLVHGRIVDIAVAVTVIEFVALALLHRVRGRGLPAAQLLRLLAPGVCLLLAVRCALAGAGVETLAILLLLALFTHVVELRGRWLSS